MKVFRDSRAANLALSEPRARTHLPMKRDSSSLDAVLAVLFIVFLSTLVLVVVFGLLLCAWWAFA